MAISLGWRTRFYRDKIICYVPRPGCMCDFIIIIWQTADCTPYYILYFSYIIILYNHYIYSCDRRSITPFYNWLKSVHLHLVAIMIHARVYYIYNLCTNLSEIFAKIRNATVASRHQNV